MSAGRWINYTFILLVVLFTSKAFSKSWSGRFILGGHSSTERFKDAGGSGSTSNDFQVLSSRFYLKGEQLGSGDFSAVMDLRDKHDFFDKLDREKLQLDSRNEFQLRQLSTQYSNNRKFWGFQLGRFPIHEAGGVYVDGLQVESNWTPTLKSSAFGGLHPQKIDRTYLKHDPKASIYGLTLTYHQLSAGWARNFYVTHGLVTQTYENHVDRNFIFENLIYQWNEDSRIITLIYFDQVPRSYIQNGYITWQNGWTRSFISELSHSEIDVIEYSRNQSVLERLPSSPYSENSLKLTYKLNQMMDRYYIQVLNGKRQVDQLQRTSGELGFIKSKVFGPHWDLYLALGQRKNFTSDDVFGRLGLGYFSRRWELNMDLEAQTQKNTNGTTTHPLIVDASLSYLFSRRLYSALAVQSASDENVQIMSGFFKIGYRFGNREAPPLRDGAPPRGAL